MHQADTYTGPERREAPRPPPAGHRQEPTLDSIWILLLEVDTKISSHIESEAHLRPHIEELVDMLQKSKGILIFLKALIYVGAPLTAFIYWLKDHVKL